MPVAWLEHGDEAPAALAGLVDGLERNRGELEATLEAQTERAPAPGERVVADGADPYE